MKRAACVLFLCASLPVGSQKKLEVRRIAPEKVTPAAIRADCNRLDRAIRRGPQPQEPVRGIVDGAQKACDGFRKGKLPSGQWLEILIELEEKSAFLTVPEELTSVIPFQSVSCLTVYDSYSFFLFPSTEWESRHEEVRRLHKQFQDFGDAIGERRLAIWFSRADDAVDARRSKLYCDRFGLDYNSGPYVVTIGKHPALLTREDKAIVISLAGISTERAIIVLNTLERDLRTEREVRRRYLLFEEVLQRLLTAAERHGDILTGIGLKLVSLK